MKKLALISLILLLPCFACGQIIKCGDLGRESVDSSKVKPWMPQHIENYQTVYKYGFSDDESYLLLFITGDSCYAQIKSPRFTADGKSSVMLHEKLTNVRIKGNMFFSDKTNGIFVVYESDNKLIPGLIVNKPWSIFCKKGESEFGHALPKESLLNFN